MLLELLNFSMGLFCFLRFQLRAYLKSKGPFKDVEFQDSDLTDAHFTGTSINVGENQLKRTTLHDIFYTFKTSTILDYSGHNNLFF